MRIVSLQAENFKRLKAVEITPDGNTVVISGKNAQGKSSVLDAIWAALAGKDGSVQRPVRDGQRKARVRLDLGEVVVERKWSGANSTLTVTAASGAKFPSPQRMLDDLIGSLSFDPLSFATMEPAKQRKTLIELVPEDAAELDRIAAERKRAYDERTQINRDAKSIKARLDALPTVTEDVAPVDIAALAQQHSEAQQAMHRRDSLLAEHARNKAEIERLQNRQAEIVAEGKTLHTGGEQRVLDLLHQMQAAEETNKLAQVRVQIDAFSDEYGDLQGQSSDLSDKINALDQGRDDTLANLSLPVEGLSFDDEGVLYNGIPFVQASAAERLRVSVAMAMALNPNIRVIRITDGSLLDSDNMALIEAMATDQDFQVWVERVSDGDGVGVRIEDGEVAE